MVVKKVIHKFIVLEGIDGSGKSSLIERVHDQLSKQGLRIFVTCEPTYDPIGMIIRRLLSDGIPVTRPSLAYLFAADRYEHLHGPEGIIKKAEEYDLVLCDRYLFSSLAYQCYQSEDLVDSLPFILNKDFPYPAVLIYLDNSPSISLDRLKNHELQSPENAQDLTRIYKNYVTILDYVKTQASTRVYKLNAQLSKEQLVDEALAILQNFLAK